MLRHEEIWGSLIELEPRLDKLLAKAAWLDDGTTPWFCASAAFGPLKRELVALVGRHAERDHPLLTSDIAYAIACARIRAALACRDCTCDRGCGDSGDEEMTAEAA